ALLLLVVSACVSVSSFLSSRRRHTRSKRDWSSDVCSSDLIFGAADKVVLAVVLAAVSAGVAVLIARVATGHPFLGELLVAGLGVLCLLLALTRPEGAPVWVLPSVLATVAAVFGLHRITRAPAPGVQPSRRVFVRSLTGMGIATVLATAGGIAV